MQITKRNNTAFKVLYLLKLLSKEPKDIDKLVYNLCNLDNENPCTKGVVLKYINTLRVAGFEINKEKSLGDYVYKITNSPSKINLNEEDIFTIQLLKSHIQAYFSSQHQETYTQLINLLKPYLKTVEVQSLSKNETGILNSNYNHLNKNQKTLVNQFLELTKENRRVHLYYKSIENSSMEKILLEPKGVHYLNNIIYFAGYSPTLNSTKLLPLDFILKIEALPSKSRYALMRKDIVFKLIGRVANGYTIRPNERLVKQEDNFIIISNNYEDKEILFKRLLRYAAYCEILHPQDIREDFIKMTKDILNIYTN